MAKNTGAYCCFGTEVKGRFHRDMGVVAAYLPWERLFFEISRLVWTKTTMELMRFSGKRLQFANWKILENHHVYPCFTGKSPISMAMLPAKDKKKRWLWIHQIPAFFITVGCCWQGCL
jgi:hypothetical protein